jgi:hypothetical protein
MRIAGPSSRPPLADDVAGALIGAVGLLGQRPAITALRQDGRREQGFASLAGWVAKGANLLRQELELGPESQVAVAGPPSWPLAAVVLSAWWVGATVIPVGSLDAAADVSVLHVHSVPPAQHPGGDIFWFGDALDGSDASSATRGEMWTDAVTPHGDRPPPAAHDGSLVAFRDRVGTTTQRMLLTSLTDGAGGVLGIERTGDADVLARPDASRLLAALALRPLVTGSATVVIGHDDVDRGAHERAERIVRWYA